MALVHMIAYIDVLSSWCHVADYGLERVQQEYADDLSVEWRIAQLFDFGPLPYTRDQLQWYYGRTARASGVQMNAAWHDSPETTTVHANRAAEAVRVLGVDGDTVRRGLSRAALLDGKPMGRREEAIAEAARLSGLPAERIAKAMDGAEVRARIERATHEFNDLALTQRPSFVLRNTIDDLAVFSGIYTFESFDAVVGEMVHAAKVNRDYGSPPDVA